VEEAMQYKQKAVSNNAKNELAKSKSNSTDGGIKKTYFKRKNICKVIFKLPKAFAPKANKICIAGDFNNWDTSSHPLKKLKNGQFTITLELEPGKDYQFRYLIDGCAWENDWKPDKYIKSSYCDADNSVVTV
jgi:1,4-alpha-glucan branching enzyme